MLFSLQFILIFAGYGAVSNLSGNYMELYTDADDFQLGIYFMIPHFLHIVRPFIGAQADRNQSYKKMYTWCALITALAYVPYICLPFLLKNPHIAQRFVNKYRFWYLVVFHIIGSVALNGCRTLADALAKNYACRMGIEYVSLRKFAPVGLGLCSFIFGFLNEEWIMPNYVPAMMLFSGCMLTLALVIHIWPDEFFLMASPTEEKSEALPSTREVLVEFANRLGRPFKKNDSYVKKLETIKNHRNDLPGELDTDSVGSATVERATKSRLEMISAKQSIQTEKRTMSMRQQLSILGLVLRRDFRISLAFGVLFLGGWICRSAQNFVFVQLEDICETKKTCRPGKLSGDVLAGVSILEFLTYVSLDLFKKFKFNRMLLIELAILSIAIHYYFFGFFIEHLPTKWFLVESLHGFEFAIFITTGLSWGYYFANEVEYLIPELKQRGIVDEVDDINLVKVSLVATMMSCMTLLYEGFGSTLGSFVYGLVIQRYSFGAAWKINGSLAFIEFSIILVCLILNRCLKIEPTMSKLKRNLSHKDENKQQCV